MSARSLALLSLLLAGCITAADQGYPIATDAAPAAIGPYSQAMRVGDVLWLSGQIGLDPRSGELVRGGVGAETRRCLESCSAVLEAAGLSLRNVVRAQVFLADIRDYAAMNEVYAEFFDEPFPARAAVAVAGLPLGARVEIVLTAVVRD